MITITSDVGAPHGPLLMVQRNVTVPMPRPVTVVVGLLGVVIVPVPFTTFQTPVLGDAGVLPASVAIGELLHTL